jgi:ElaB/YqjD/DUF883 family membrane-anchored ribosome-binding protein
MALLIEALQQCLGIAAPRFSADHEREKLKAALIAEEPRTADRIADDIVRTLLRAEKTGTQLERELDRIVGDYGWTEKIAEWVLAKLEKALREADKLGPAVKEAYDKACEVAREIEGFVHEHPVFVTVIALGVLVSLTPWVLTALGFAELGPVEGQCASKQVEQTMMLILL